MGKNEAMSFSQLNARRAAEFISYREAIEKLAAETKDSLTEVASTLKAYGFHEHGSAWLAGAERRLSRGAKGELAALLDYTINCNEIKSVAFDFEFDDTHPDLYGWVRNDFVSALIDSFHSCPESITSPIPYLSSNAPAEQTSWLAPYQSRIRLTLSEAAHLLAGCDPYDSGFMPNELGVEVHRWELSLIDGVDSGQINAGQWSDNRSEQSLLHADIRVWCKKNEIEWPLSDPSEIIAPEANMEIPATDEGLKKRLSEEVQRRTDVEKKLKETESANAVLREEVSKLQKESDDLRRAMGDGTGMATHNTQLMKIALEVQRKYWKDINFPPKQEVLVSEIMNIYGLDEFPAKAIERVACPIVRSKKPKK